MSPVKRIRSGHNIQFYEDSEDLLLESLSRKGRRYFRWKGKLLVVLTFLLFIVCLEWSLHGSFKSETKLKKSQPVFPLVRGRCGQRFALPNGAPAKCDPSVATCCSSRVSSNLASTTADRHE